MSMGAEKFTCGWVRFSLRRGVPHAILLKDLR